MSYNKNTYSFSDITPLVRELMRRKENYHLASLGDVSAMSVNDNIDVYTLRILIYSGGVVVEQMRKMNDCDSDDVVVSETFNFDEVPTKWPLVRVMDYYDYEKCQQYQNYVLLGKYKKFIEEFVK